MSEVRGGLSPTRVAGSFDASFRDGHPHARYAEWRAGDGLTQLVDRPVWLLTRHADILRVAGDPITFCSRRGVLISDIDAEHDFPPTIMHTDPPDHTRYRTLVAPAFRPAVMRGLADAVRARVREHLDRLPVDTPVDVVEALAVPLPLQVICALLGLPADDWTRLYEWSDAIVPGATPLAEEQRETLKREAAACLLAAARERRAAPRDDVISTLATAELDGDRLSDSELLMFLVQLLVAGNETTRHAVSAGLVAFAEAPDEWRRLRADPGLLPTAAEEVLRWTSPVAQFLRTATTATEVGGTTVRPGERVMLLFGAANRDERVFGPHADRFDVGRRPNPHLGFGFGPHFCLGAALARLEVRVVLEEASRRFAAIHRAGPVRWTGSPVVCGPRQAPLVLEAA